MSTDSSAFDPRVILLAPQDNCVIAATTLEAGTALVIDGEQVVLASTVPLGHKLARRPLAADEKVLRYGAPIGHVTLAVERGAHLHMHNLVSDYLPTYTHEAGHSFVDHDHDRDAP
ncbi:UxaA family hydrolase [Trinickia caryophylli]|uniref:SAF domain-containing protein n=1 Tax=Trinickia caryophylli TaxID=28094 RepID=A0A1X7H4L2_TRICW|nr:UxaA family hydrolase [Trinickia caryophylli]PMS09608.1 hydrolase [Trinickia caryophylli]WQE12009.1 UxaA family hydrolase [Trinickia caryophylli]GLU35598.1 hydrolase [Trinickia caryophylli]SMF79768.1 SAF domain-containing protein [Trinickia caryophylli]